MRTKRKKKIKGTSLRPRLVVTKTNKFIYAQIVDDETKTTMAFVSSMSKEISKGPKMTQAKLIGDEIAKRAQAKGVKEIIFDRNGYLYHGIIKTLAENARQSGLVF